MTYKYVVLDPSGRVVESFDDFKTAFLFVTKITLHGDDIEDVLDQGILLYTIMKVQRVPFTILREVKITIHDEIRRKEAKRHGSTKDHSCNDLFKEW